MTLNDLPHVGRSSPTALNEISFDRRSSPTALNEIPLDRRSSPTARRELPHLRSDLSHFRRSSPALRSDLPHFRRSSRVSPSEALAEQARAPPDIVHDIAGRPPDHQELVHVIAERVPARRKLVPDEQGARWCALPLRRARRASCGEPESTFARVRIGLLVNDEDDCGTPDSYVGFGGEGDNGRNPVSYGPSAGSAGGDYCSGGASVADFGYVFVR